MSPSRLFADRKWISLTPSDREPFSIKIDEPIQDVDDLKTAIKREKANDLRDIDADQIKLEYPSGTVLASDDLVITIQGGDLKKDPILARLS